MRRKKKLFILGIMFMLVFVLTTSEMKGAKKQLTYKQVFLRQGEKLLRPIPRFVKWLNDLYFIQSVTIGEGAKAKSVLQKVDVRTGNTEPVEEKKAGKNLPGEYKIDQYTLKTKDESACLFVRKGDIYYYSLEKDLFIQLTKTGETEKNPTFSPDGSFVAYTRNKNLYVFDINARREIQVTSDGSEVIFNGWASWVYYEEIIGRRSRYKAFWWSPDSKRIVFLRFDNRRVPIFTLVRSRGVHGEVEATAYPKPGDPNPLVTLGIYNLADQKTVWVDTDPRGDHYIAWPQWSPDGKTLFFQKLNRGQDHLTLYSTDLATGSKKKIHEEKQDSWVDFFEDLHLLAENRGFILKSSIDGWSHLYYYTMEGRLRRRLTSGNWRVRSIEKIDEERGYVYFSGFRNNSTENHLFRVGFSGRGLRQLSTTAGNHRLNISPGFRYYVDTYSSVIFPTRSELYSIRGKLIRSIGDSKSPVMDQYALGRVELFTIPSGDGYNLPAVWVLPPDYDRNKKYPVLFRIYGGPDAGSVRNYYRGLSDHYLAQQGIIIFTVDHRGSGHFGKKGAALMHRCLGKWEMHDYIAAVKWLRNISFVDPDRIAISGGSYGGYVTCMALTYGADYFTHGIASSSVTDWKLYDSVYTERYMDTPEENPQGYKEGSVIEYAKNLKGVLHILHGEMDDNVHQQNSLQLISKLQDLNKDFTFMCYPDGRHGWGGPKRIHSTRKSIEFWFRHLLNRKLDVNRD